MELTLSQLRDLEKGDKVWVNVVVEGADKGTYEVEVLAVDALDHRDTVAVMFPIELAVDLGIKDIIEERTTWFTGEHGYRYWVENLQDYEDEHDVRIAAVTAPDKITDKTPAKPKQAETGNPKNELKWSDRPFKSYSVTEIQDMIHAGIIPSGLAFFKTREEFECAMDKVAGKLLKFVIFDTATDDMQIFETYIDEFSESNMGCRIIFNEHQYQPIGLPSDFDEIQRFKKFLKGHYLNGLVDSQIFISVLNPTRLGTGLLDLRSHLFLLAENFEVREELDNPEPLETPSTETREKGLPVDPDAPLVSYYGKIYRNVKVANPNPDFAIIQDAETQEVRIAYLDTSDVFVIKKEMIEDIKKFGY